MILWVSPKGLSHFCSDLYSILGSGWLYSTAVAVLGGHLMVPASAICWDLLLQQGFSNNLFYRLSSWCQVSTFLQGHQQQQRLHLHQLLFLASLSLSCSPWLVHVFKTSTIWVILTHYQVQLPAGGLSLEHRWFLYFYIFFYFLCSQKALPRRFHLSNADLFLRTVNSLAPINQYQLFL